MLSNNILKNKNFLIYGLGVTGRSVYYFFKRSNIKNIFLWDDDQDLRKKFKIKSNSIDFKKKINRADFIILSPGINLRKSKYKKILLKNQSKFITDIDLFFLTQSFSKSIVVTGTNGKSTTCSVIEKVFKKSGYKTIAVGNIGKPILDYSFKKNSIVVIEMSSFQLQYSQFIKPDYAILLNISKDHLDWHGSMRNYIASKFKIFKRQKKKNNAYIFNSKKFINFYKRKNFKGRLFIINKNIGKFIHKNLNNRYLSSNNNIQNLSFIYLLIKDFRISDKIFFSSLKSFRGLPHRQEIFYKKNKIFFINDSKATSFESAKECLTTHHNIFWILGGLKKDGDKFFLNKIKKNIIKAFIIGKDTIFFKKQLNGKIPYEETFTLKRTIISIYKKIKLYRKITNKDFFVILSPASASYDQFQNFEQRGNQFKKLTISYARKYF